MQKLGWCGEVLSVQLRASVVRTPRGQSITYQGYLLQVQGTVEGLADERFTVALGPQKYQKWLLRAGDVVQGLAVLASPEAQEPYLRRVSQLTVVARAPVQNPEVPPWDTKAPNLIHYRSLGCRPLSEDSYESACRSCVWAARMPVTLMDHDGSLSTPSDRSTETFCYGPPSCSLYRPDPERKATEDAHRLAYV